MDYDTLYTKYRPLVHSAAMKGGVRYGEIDDFIQEVFLEIARCWEDLQDKEDGYQVASLKRGAKFALTHWHGHSRGGKTATAVLRESIFPMGSFQDPSDPTQLNSSETRFLPSSESAEDSWFQGTQVTQADSMWEASKQLSDRQRECVTLRYYNELTIDEIMAKTGLSKRQVAAGVSDGVARLAEILNPGEPMHSIPRGRMPETTHCKYGHEFTEENTNLYTSKDGYLVRKCRPCATEKTRERRAKGLKK